ncbi:conserved hypothetical protein [Altererythrobacter sp. B11]|uniref:hypothetical protein n=1 Tax=Altererythrobacter sp. B11 TaxID=2060312 RepID=UPI000DC70B33|nr:hypothetical protein [Altererythrobacter sp. B11]BBC71122.1 conserved hypothetical protein [Altererythrobacter sp. B11]
MFRKYQNVFRSRWRALWWAAGVLLTAYCTVPAGHGPEKAPTPAAPHHTNPWALEKHG